ncbi:MAG: hypothetical protein RLY63_941, partial [Chloroflexota bacterium]
GARAASVDPASIRVVRPEGGAKADEPPVVLQEFLIAPHR